MSGGLGTFSYPKNTHITLPSVEGGFGTMNILRDPPKSIQTRYKPRVGDTSQITKWIDESGDRACEAINKYARGVNPMVSVSYSNYGTNGGQMRDHSGASGSDQVTSFGNRQAFLPYRVARDGAFRPPIIPPQELLPLSRLPRLTTTQTANPGSALMRVENLMQCKTDLRAVRNELMHVCAAPKATFNIDTPRAQVQIKNNLREELLNATAQTNASKKTYQLGVNAMPERGIKDFMPYAAVSSKAFKNIQAIPIDQAAHGQQPMRIQDKRNYNVSAGVTRQGEAKNHVVYSKQHKRNTPATSMVTNTTQKGVDLNQTLSSRKYSNLPERTSRGGFSNGGVKPRYDREQKPATGINQKKTIYQRAAASQYDR